MPTPIVDNVPAELYDHLRRRAEQERRSIPEETLHLLEQALRQDRTPAPRRPDFLATEEISAPYDLPRSSRPVPARRAGRTCHTMMSVVSGHDLRNLNSR